MRIAAQQTTASNKADGEPPETGEIKEGEMPAEKFYMTGQVEDDGREPDVTIAWGETPSPQVAINGLPFSDRSGLNRMIGALRRARDQVYGADT